MNLAVLGLGFIVLAWVFQVVKSWKSVREISSVFIWLYIVGVLLLVYDGWMNSRVLALLNVIGMQQT